MSVPFLQAFSLDSAADRLMLGETILHACDICNPVLPRARSMAWAMRVAKEFQMQANEELSRGMPVTSFMALQMEGNLSKLTPENVAVAKLNFNFINYVVEPLWRTLAEFFPELQECIVNLKGNQRAWQAIVDRATHNKSRIAGGRCY
jgi:hypothetical protein